MIAIACNNLVKKYGSLTAVDRIDLEIQTGECFGLLGPNGAGKTTTAELLEGLLLPDSGQIKILGTEWKGRGDRELREKLGVALQQTELTEKLSVKETLELFASFYSKSKDISVVMSTLGLTEKKDAWVSKLSGGQRQRLALATSLVGSPDILFLDEPTTGLDPQARRRIWDVVEDFKNEGGTVLLTTHYMEEAERLCDRIGIMDRGKLIAMDTPANLIDTLDAAEIIELVAKPPLDQAPVEAIEGVRSVDWHTGNGLHMFRVAHLETTLPALLDEVKRQEVTLTSLRTRRATLEDVFVKLTGRALRDE